MEHENETIIFEADLKTCERVRIEIQNKYDGVWLFVYKNKNQGKIAISNSYGGKLGRTQSNEISVFAKTFNNKIKILK